ncbi:hypothetical protein RvY_00553-2 [Ramazzottius varieornatus]|uniref:Uncharacterized protein n=1 Tax=Ramazzottius varieornatus TaxID=947166 RepID=A0A1D1UE42_RAMVA|nr:hypothetical protein RvY_00553-2 [Ramazzottius varieornatus]
MDEGRLNVQDELAGIALDIMRSFRSLDQNGMDGQAIGKLAAVVEKLFLQASNMASELDENRERISELCQQVEEYLERNGDLRDELRSLKDNHEKVVLSMEKEHDKEMEVHKACAKTLEAANNSLRARNQQLVSDIIELQDSNQRYEHLAPKYKSQVAELEKNLEGLQKALMKSDQLVEEAKSSGNPPVVKSSTSFSHASVQTEFPPTTSNIQDIQDKLKVKASKLVWLSEMKEGLSDAITHLDCNMKEEPGTDVNELDLSLADELQQADVGRKVEDKALLQGAFPAKNFETYFKIRDQPIEQNRSGFFKLKVGLFELSDLFFSLSNTL